MTDVLVEAQHLTVGHDGVPLLANLEFAVRRGEIFVILGGSGCGKSTLLKHLIGLLQPQSGDILIAGQSIVTADAEQCQAIRRLFGVLYQSGALFGSMTLLQNVALPLEEHTTLPPALIAALARLKLRAVGLAGFEDHLPDQISGGMKKRAGLARALALDPVLVFLDEPSAGLDPITSAGLDELLRELRDRFGVTLVIVTHELDSIYAVADRVIMLKDQRIVAEGAPRDLAQHHPDEWVRRFFTRAGTKAL